MGDILISSILDHEKFLRRLLDVFRHQQYTLYVWGKCKHGIPPVLQGRTIPVSMLRRIAFEEQRYSLTENEVPEAAVFLRSIAEARLSWGLEIGGRGVLLARTPEDISLTADDDETQRALYKICSELGADKAVDSWEAVTNGDEHD